MQAIKSRLLAMNTLPIYARLASKFSVYNIHKNAHPFFHTYIVNIHSTFSVVIVLNVMYTSY